MRTLSACAALAAVMFAAGCVGGGDEDAPPADPRARSAQGAESAANEAFESYAAGDYGGFWDIWLPDAQALISREDYVRGMRTCEPVAQGWPFDVTKVRMVGSDHAVVQGRRTARDLDFSYSFRYVDGHWRFDPLADQRAAYAQGVAKWVEFMRRRGACSTPSETWAVVY